MLTRQRAKPLRLQLDRKTITFATLDDLAFALASRTSDAGLLLLPTGTHGNVIRLLPRALARLRYGGSGVAGRAGAPGSRNASRPKPSSGSGSS